MNTQHKNPSYKNRVAVAPYNFVPLPEAILTVDAPPPHDRYDSSLHTGKLRCTLTTASPLYVRAARTWEEYSHRDTEGKADPVTPSDPFYGETKETLLIPGSSLRGMLRNMVEVVSYSKIAPVTKQPLFFRTVDVSSIGKAYGKRMSGGDAAAQGWQTLSNAGYMELDQNGDYFIRPALEFFGAQHYRIEQEIVLRAIPELKNMAAQKENGKWGPNRDYRWLRKELWFKPAAPVSHLPESPTFFAEVEEISVQEKKPAGDGWQPGWLIAGGWVPSPKGGRGKHRHWIIGPPNPDDNLRIQVSDEDIDLYKERTGGFTQAVDRGKMSVLPLSRNPAPIPCFYTTWTDEEGTPRLAFGHTGMFRLPYQKAPGDMLPDNLKSVEGLDLAEAMFGFVDQKKSERAFIAGRISVTDAFLQSDQDDPKNAMLDPITLSDQAMSGPKATTIQHYLNQSDPDHPDQLKHYDSNPNTETALRGHKFYWHVGSAGDLQKRLERAPKFDPANRANDKSNRFKPVKENQLFVFDIHFENLRAQELGALLWVLDKAANPKYRLKLGMGKSYGFGSIGVSFDAHLDNRAKRYEGFFDSTDWTLPDEQKQAQLEAAKNAFEQFVLANANINPNNAKSVEDLPRIKELLALLSWESSPAEEKTRYMELDEFTGRKHISDGISGRPSRRPVLPSATKVADHQWFAGLPNEEPRSNIRNQSASQPAQRQQPAPAPTPALVRSTPVRKEPTPPPAPRVRPPREALPEAVDKAPGKLKPGDIIKAIAESDASAKSEVILLLNNTEADVAFAFIPANGHPLRRYKKGEQVLLRVTSVEGNRKQGFQINCEPVD